ncbi:BQ5605_C028g10475 [Microbotryum silenes-dioicae]|uniref:Carboxylic ester hydrolase n=1 Tax=Microbotryum silenes-dioicae TaxID=796604 RepID=A0A2X0MIL9_9BASI|nr:BQ5605_C028g10475 [Microbotryum silenes-dioicae]
MIFLGPFVLPTSDPTTWKAAMAHHKSHEWAQGAIDEFESLRDDYSVFTIMKRDKLPAGAKVLGSKFIFRTKRDKDGWPTSYKARLVARGFTKRPGIDFKEMFAPTAKFVSIRTLIALAAARGYHIIQADIDKAYLHGELEEELYMRVPEGIRLPDNVCLKLHRSIYGLKQAGRVWNETIHKTLVKLGYNCLRSEECVYRRTLGKDDYYIAVYVDDLLFVGPDLSEIDRVLDKLDRLYGVKRLGNAEYILSVQLIRQAGGIALSQRQYLLDVLARFGMADANKSVLPMQPGLQLKPCDTPDPSLQTQYRSAIGSLMYTVVATQPDLAYPVSYLARFTNKAGSDHSAAVLKILRYIKGTLELGIVYKAKRDSLVGYVGYSNSDWGSCINTSRSTMGHVFKLADGPISWSSRIQSRVATSSTEAEYIGLTHASRECQFLQNLLTELGITICGPIELKGDKKGVIALTKNPVYHDRTKHLRLTEHFFQERVREGDIVVNLLPWCPRRSRRPSRRPLWPFTQLFHYLRPSPSYQVLNKTSPQPLMVNSEAEFEKLLKIADDTDPGQTNAIDPDISKFLSRGKLITYVDLADSLIPARSSLLYYDCVKAKLGNVDESYCLFAIPGMSHCGGGNSAFNLGQASQRDISLGGNLQSAIFTAKDNMILALIAWVEKNQAPDSLVGVNYVNGDKRLGVAFERRMCRWPKFGYYTNGDPTKASSFACT